MFKPLADNFRHHKKSYFPHRNGNIFSIQEESQNEPTCNISLHLLLCIQNGFHCKKNFDVVADDEKIMMLTDRDSPFYEFQKVSLPNGSLGKMTMCFEIIPNSSR